MALQATEKLLEKSGLAGLTARKVASAIGYTVGTLYLVFRNQDEPDSLPQLVTATSAYRLPDEATGQDFLVLVDGYRYEGEPGQAGYRVMEFGKYGERVEFEPHDNALPTRYEYRVQWDTRRSRTKPSGEIETGTWLVELPREEGRTQAAARPQPIPVIRRRY